jgi:hypothetical protein
MTLHDADILRFGQWWKRAVRGGYGAMDVATRFGQHGLFVQQMRSARIWTLGWSAAVLVAAGIGAAVFQSGTAAVALAAAAAVLLPLQIIRLTVRARRRAGAWPTAFAYGVLTMIGKWANLVGQLRYFRDRSAGRNTRLIEYKTSCATPITKPT